jgi:hypothetical protein
MTNRPTQSPATGKCRMHVQLAPTYGGSNGKGLNVQIASGVSVSCRLILREYSEEAEDEKRSAKRRK